MAEAVLPRVARRVAALVAALSLVAVAVPGPAAAATSLGTYRDSFWFVYYGNTNGSLTWEPDWVEMGDDGSAVNGAVKISPEVNCPSLLCLVIGRESNDASIQRSADLSTADTATLSISYQRHKHGVGAGSVRLSASPNGSNGWLMLDEFPLDIDDASVVAEQYDLTPFISASTTIRFELVGGTDASHLNVEDVAIELFSADNVAPVLDPIVNATIPEGSEYTFTATAEDPNVGDVLDFKLDGNEPAGAAITPDGDFSWTPSEAQGPGVYSFDVIVCDDGEPKLSDSQTVTLTVDEVNDPPTIDPVGDKAVTEGSLLSFTATGSDAETPAAQLRFELYGAPPAGATMTSDGDFAWTPTEAQGPGSYNIEIKLWDDGEPPMYDYEVITVTVVEENRAPSLSAIPRQTIDEGAPFAYTVSVSDPDLPANDFDYSVSGAPAGVNIDAGGTVTWTPTDAQGPGTYVFDVVVTDDGSPALSDTTSMEISVLEANIAPAVTPIAAKSIAERSTLAFTASAVDPDTPANSFTFSLAGAPSGATITPGGAFTWTPTEAQGPGVFVFDVVATDTGVPPMSGSAEVTVTVTEVNTPPSLAPIEPQTIDEGAEFSLQLEVADADLPANSLSYSLQGAPTGVAVSSAGRLTWTPSEEQGPGNFIFDITVTDNGSPKLSATQTISFSVRDANNPPVIDPLGSKSVVEGETLTFTASAVDPDVPANTFWFRLDGTIPAGATMSSAGAFNWTPSEVQGPGSYTFDVVVTDTGSPSRSSSTSVTVIVLEDNQPPVLNVAASHSAEAGLPFVLQLNATDEDLPAQRLDFSASGLPAGAVLSGSTLTWTPDEELVGGSVEISVTVSDSGTPSLSATETITVDVLTANLAPVLAPIGDKAAVVGEMLTFRAEATDGDDPPDLLRFSLSADAPAGARIDAASGTFEWRPTPAQDNTAFRFSVIVTDDGTVPKSDSETITVNVGTPNAPPVLTQPPTQTSTPGEEVTLEITATDPDAYPRPLVFSAGDLPPGLDIDPSTGTISGRVGFDGLAGSPHLVSITVDDGAAQASIEFSWEVTGVGDPGAATPTRRAVVSSINEVRAAPVIAQEAPSDIGRTLVLMARAVRVGAADVSLPFALLLVAIGAVLVFGRIGLVPMFKRRRREEGMVLSYDATAGTGLVARHSDGGEVFVHATAIARRDRRTLVPGDPVLFRTVDGAYRDLVTKLRKRH